MPEDLAHRVEFRTGGDGQCRSRVAAAMVGDMLVNLAVLHPFLQDILHRAGGHLKLVEHPCDTCRDRD